MKIMTIMKKCERVFLFLFCFIFFHQYHGESFANVILETTTPQEINLTVGKSTIIRSIGPVKRVSLAAPEIADATVLTPRQIYITGKVAGITNLTLWDKDDRVSAIFDLKIAPDVSQLKQKIYELFPEEKDIKITTAHDSITLSGTISSANYLSQILNIAEFYAPEKITNLMEVTGVQQVMLEVRVAEISRSLMRRLGFNFDYLSSSGRVLGIGFLNNLTSLPDQGETGTVVTDNINAIFRFMGGDTTWTVFIDALKEEGLVKVLAKPTLVTLSGQPGNFLAGGEFPVPVPQEGDDTITIEWKTFGVGLSFTPTVLSDERISMKIAPEVSELDFTNSATLSGFVIPGLNVRRVSTTIELADGQSFAIAGLIQEHVRELINKYPLLGDIPILGALFRSTEFQKNETELIVIVTPHLVKPLDMENQHLPTDEFIEPDDFEWYLLGKMEGRKKSQSLMHHNEEPGMEGDFGHIMP
jgi:pilus assembly protein CpaC